MVQVASHPVALLPLRLWWWCGDRELLWLCLGFELVLLLDQVRWHAPQWQPYTTAACCSLEHAYFWGGVAVALTVPPTIPAVVSPRVRARQRSLQRLEGPLAIAILTHSLLLVAPTPVPAPDPPDWVSVTVVDWVDVPEAVTESVAEAVPEPAAEPVPEPVPEPIPEPAPEAIPEPALEPVAEAVPESIPEPIAEPVPEAIPEPALEPVAEAVPEPVPEPIAEPIPEAIPEPAPEPVATPPPPQFTPLIEGLRAAESSSQLTPILPVSEAASPPESEPRPEPTPESVAALPEPILARPIPGQNPQPDYPAAARRLNQQGQVVVRALVTVQGQVTTVEVSESSGFPALDEAARRTVSGWGFTPAQQGDQPIESWVMVPIVFSLQ